MTKEQSSKITIISLLFMAVAILATIIIYYTKPTQTDVALETWDNSGEKHPVHINQPEGAPLVDSNVIAHDGSAVKLRCNTCHDTKQANKLIGDAKDLKNFHQGMHFKHASLKCVSCHDSNDYESLHLADGSKLPFTKVMTLCAQCHGPQYRDYKNGSHGGMKGHWDLTKGPRQRNGCTDCHSAHAPKYPKVMPVFPPKRRAGSKQPHAH